MDYLFEVSWEVCNKIGGIYTTIRSKVPQAVETFGDGYFLFGPLLSENPEFKETKDPQHSELRNALNQKGLKYKIGRWQVPGEPQTILIDFQGRYDVNKILYGYWRDFGVDSYAGRWDYMEPILFSTAVGEAIEAVHTSLVQTQDKATAHFHEWMMGGGLLYLKKHKPSIAQVFTTHSTTLGRVMAALGRDVHSELDTLNPRDESQTYGVSAKHCMESTCARESDCFSTISRVTAEESAHILARSPKVVESGLNFSVLPPKQELPDRFRNNREFLLNFCSKFLLKDLPETTKFWITSGRYEFHNKGYDVLLEALAELDRKLAEQPSAPEIVVLLLIATGHKGVNEAVSRRVHGEGPTEPGTTVGLVTHRLQDEQNDPIIKACNRLMLRNSPNNKVHIIFSTAYLDGHDGIFDRTYEQILSGCDLGVFPSFYDPWGYTPLESIAYGVPALTTDLAGFGDWAVQATGDEGARGVYVVPRRGLLDATVTKGLTQLLTQLATVSADERITSGTHARELAEKLDWRNYYQSYLTIYREALERASRRAIPDTSALEKESLTIDFTGTQHSETPRFRSFTAVSALPPEVKGLQEIAYNLWWSWNPEARELFNDIDSQLWVASDCNPVKLLNEVSNTVIQRKLEDKDFMQRFQKVYNAFKSYMNDESFDLEPTTALSPSSPIAYFSLEFALHECLPIYSGGLGVLSGDHLKAASDLNLPFVGIGLFYRQGYFIQNIDRQGQQHEQYPSLDCAILPVKALLDEHGNEARVSVKLPGRLVHARVWIVQVGRIKLYLMDSDVPENEPGDRHLTSQLYGGDKRTRIKQEILISIGGVRLLKDVLKMVPAVYHLNEGHCAFLIMERIKLFMESGLSFEEAREAVKASTVFTTHTPVPAGNETFNMEVLGHYLRDYIAELGIAWEQFVELGKQDSQDQEFCMTVLALKLSSKANGVAKLHGRVSRDMWKNIWKGVNVDDVPIFSITNGVHLQTFTSQPMRALLDRYIPIKWGRNEDDRNVWSKVHDIPDAELWRIKQQQKRDFIERLRAKITDDYTRRGEDPQLIKDTLRELSADHLLIGFARRFATYKRGDLFLRDWNRIVRILGNHDRPAHIIVAGKAHPADVMGKEIIKIIVNAARTPELKGKVIFLENYDMGIGRLLTRGVDVWLNNPIRPMEASGTSGMKVAPNAGLNCSILDGWWDEAYTPDVGWEINPGVEYRNREHQDEMDNVAMLDTLENEVIPLFYDRFEQELPAGWLRMVKTAMANTIPFFNTLRMVREYYNLSYLPTAKREQLLQQNNYQDIRALTAWKRMISARFGTVQIPKVEIKGITSDDILEPGGKVEVNMYVYPGQLEPQEIQAEFVFGVRQGNGFADRPQVVQFDDMHREPGSDILHYRLTHTIQVSGNYLYAVRVLPVHKLLSVPQETGLMCWG